MNILITGSNGLLGSSIHDFLSSKGEDVFKFDRNQFSWLDQKKNIENFRKFDLIIHAAANTNVEFCEKEPSVCYRDNTFLTERLASASASANCKFIFISSTGIYGSEKDTMPYTEYDFINPTTHHHKSKWLAEQAINKYCQNSLILRTSWIFGGLPNNSKNFVVNRIKEALLSEDKIIFSNNEQYGVPTFSSDFAELLYKMIQNDEIGTFNVINGGCASRFEYVSKIIEFASLDVEVIPTSAKTFNRIANVSNNEKAISLKLKELGYANLPDWSVSLEQYIKNDLSKWLIGTRKNAKS